MAASKTEKKHNIVLEVVIASVIAMIISLVLILLSALLIKALDLGEGWLVPLNQVTKAISLFFGAFFAFKDRNRGWMKGLALGIVYIFLAFIVFSLMNMRFSIDITFLYDLIFGALMGLICGVLVVNIRKR